MPVIRRLALALLLLVAGWNAPAHAACVLTAERVNLGTVSTYDVREGRVPMVSGGAGLACNGSIISVISSNYARASVVSASGFRLRDSAGNSVRYRLSADSGGNYDLSSGATIDYFDPSLVRLLGILSSESFAPKAYAAVMDAPNLPPGVYTDTVTINWSWQVCHGIGLAGVCVLAEVGSGSTTVTVTLVATKDCRISAPDLSFGSAPLAAGFVPVRQAVAVDCSLGTSFGVAFTAGTSGASRPWRAMTGPRGARLEYNIFRLDGTLWDEATPTTIAGTGTGAVVPGLVQTYVARINPAQTDPPAGSYADTLSVVITF